MHNNRVVWGIFIGLSLLLSGCGSDRAGNFKGEGKEVVVDSDGDGLTDSYELSIGTSPYNVDTDRDGLDDGYEDEHGLNPIKADTDGDRISDGEEVNTLHTDPLDPKDPSAVGKDTDGDGLGDAYENLIGTSITNPDTDGDGLSDGDEVHVYHTDPKNVDSDGDGLSDGDEVNTYHTNPNDSDSDDDGISDGDEVNTAHSDPNDEADPKEVPPDTDGDGLGDAYENLIGTSPIKTDTDGDGLSDGDEVNTYHTDPTNTDSDGDGLSDGDEVNTYHTNPNDFDSDDDGLTDGAEIKTTHTNPNDSKDPKEVPPDSDGDGLSDDYENGIGTSVSKPDTDGDGLKDGDEVNVYHTNPKNSDSDTDGLDDKYEIENGLNPINADTDGDGLSDGEEVNTYDTDPKDSDSDNDGISDGDEVNTYHSDPKDMDSDDDGLNDGLEVNTYHSNPMKTDSDDDGLEDKYEVDNGLNPSNPDTDGDCLLDSFELNEYHTDANNSDTDGDGVEDGIEIYSYSPDNLKVACLTSPETLLGLSNNTPAKDNLYAHDEANSTDVINALDPLNDSDGDGQVNIKEVECKEEGNPKDKTKMCPWAIENADGTALVEYGFAYIPGGFDVDKDGINEGGFWVSSYQARKTGVEISKSAMGTTIGKVNSFIQKKFKMVNATELISETITGYIDAVLVDPPKGNELDFSDEVKAGTKRLSNMMPFVAMASLEKFKLTNRNGEVVDINVSMPSLKQYAHIKKLLDADKANGGDGTHIRNGLLAVDKNVPLAGYGKIIQEFGTGYKEYLSSIMQMKNSAGEVVCTGCPWVRDWMDIDTNNVLKNEEGAGANSTIDIGMGGGSSKDNYGVLVRGGRTLDLTQGPAGIETDDTGTHNGISFRGATPYLY